MPSFQTSASIWLVFQSHFCHVIASCFTAKGIVRPGRRPDTQLFDWIFIFPHQLINNPSKFNRSVSFLHFVIQLQWWFDLIFCSFYQGKIAWSVVSFNHRFTFTMWGVIWLVDFQSMIRPKPRLSRQRYQESVNFFLCFLPATFWCYRSCVEPLKLFDKKSDN